MPRVTLPDPMQHQIEVLSDPSRFKVVICGRRWGKSVVGLLACTEGHGPGYCMRGALQGAQIRWIAPTYPIASAIWKSLKASLWECWTKKDEVERTINLPGGGSVTVRSADNPDSLRGVGSDGVVFDEFAFADASAWEEAIRPTLADRQGWVIFISTPNGYNYAHDMFQQAEHRPGWRRWQRPSCDNPLITSAEIEEAKRTTAEFRFRQEWLAEFVAPGIGFFRREHWKFIDAAPAGDWSRVRAWDFAATEVKEGRDPDYTAGAVVGCDHEGRYLILDVRRMRGTPGDRERYIRNVAEAERHLPVYFPQDPGSAGVDVVDHYIRRVLPGWRAYAHKESGDKAHRAEPLAAQVQIGNVYLLRAPWNADFLNECDMFPQGEHDDQVDAASLAFRMLTRRAGPLPTVERSTTVESAIGGMTGTTSRTGDDRAWLRSDPSSVFQ